MRHPIVQPSLQRIMVPNECPKPTTFAEGVVDDTLVEMSVHVDDIVAEA